MENCSFQLLWGDARTLLFSAAILALAALIGFFVCVLLYKSVARFTRKSTSILHLLLAKQTRPPVRYILPLLALTTALPTTPLPDGFKSGLEHFVTTVFVYVDYTLPVAPIRQELQRSLQETNLWNGKTCVLHSRNSQNPPCSFAA